MVWPGCSPGSRELSMTRVARAFFCSIGIWERMRARASAVASRSRAMRRASWTASGTTTTITSARPRCMPASKSSGTSRITTAFGSSPRMRSRRRSVSSRTHGWMKLSSTCFSTGSLNTMSPSRRRSISPSGSRMSRPKCATMSA